MFIRFLFLILMVLGAGQSGGVLAGEDLHSEFNSLLGSYVTEEGVRYGAWADAAEDLQRLSSYIDHLEAVSPGTLDRGAELAYWINLYNAVTLELVLSNYPLDSIKDTAGFLRSPWNKKLVVVEGSELSLNAIENEIIRPRFQDARIHFALNCASVGCPPLAQSAYRADSLDDQLDNACRRALNDPRWVRIESDRLILSKIFDWYREDFERDAGSVKEFITPYREVGEVSVEGLEGLKIKHADYDWSLNRVE